MCQLCLVNLNSIVLNRTWAIEATYINSMTNHKDGFGISSRDTIYKLKRWCWNITDWVNYCDFINIHPVISHVRKASYVRSEKLVGNKEFNHPFSTENLILAHNGTLEPYSDSEVNKFVGKNKKIVDSYMYLKVLDSYYRKNKGDIIKSLNDAMSYFHGKFAFLIYEKSTKRYFVIRGKSADLHYLPIDIYNPSEKDSKKNSGFVINTEKESLRSAYCLVSNKIIPLLGGKRIYWEDHYIKNHIKLLDEESIFLVKNNELIKIGEIKENSAPVKVYQTNSHYNRPFVQSNFYNTALEKELLDGLMDFKLDWGISYIYLDLMFVMFNGKGLVEQIKYFIKYFVNEIIPEINAECAEKSDMVDIWEEIKLYSGCAYDYQIHKRYGLKFPWFYSDEENIVGLHNYLEEEYNKKNTKEIVKQ